MKIVFLFDPVTLEYTGMYEAHPSPLEPGVFIIPTNSTEEVPPEYIQENEVPCFISGTWIVRPDFRTQTIYSSDGEEKIVSEIGEIPDGYSLIDPSVKKFSVQDQLLNEAYLMMDMFAQTRKYDSMLSACSYTTSSIPKFAIESKYCVELRDQILLKVFSIIDSINDGSRIITDVKTVLEELPKGSWPI